jgi:hypothetical protein
MVIPQVVQNSATTAAVAKESGYGARGAFKEDPLKNWLLKHNPTKEQVRLTTNQIPLRVH